MKTLFRITLTILCFVGTLRITNAAIITSAGSGSWNVGTTWVGGVVPTTTDNAVIASSHTVTLTLNRTITNFTINTGGIFSDGGFNLTVSGNLVINGTYNGNGSGQLLLTGNGTTIDGSGIINNINRMNMTAGTTKTILATANLTFTGTNQRIAVPANNTVTNNGTITLIRITGSNATTSKWINATNAVLNISADFLSTGTLTASATNNIINYNGSATQAIKTATYYHLILSNASAKKAGAPLTINGNFTISGTATFNGGTSRTHTFLGNWIVNTSAVTPFSFTTASTVNFNTPVTLSATSIGGASATTIGFNNVNINNTSGFSSSRNFNITGTLTVAANVIFTPAAAAVINSTATQGAITGTGTVQVTRTAATADYISQYKFTTHTLINLTVDYAGTTAQSASALTYGNLKISNTAATVTASGNITVNGVLTLNSNLLNGDLAMGANTMTMGVSATTAGLGDVTGIVRRININPNTAYSFGNSFTIITFIAQGTLPTSMSVLISIGAAPSWKTDAISRFYDIIQTGGSGYNAAMQLHYRDEEYNGNTETSFVVFGNAGFPTISEYGQSSNSTTNNWVERSNFTSFATSFGTTSGWTLSNKTVSQIIWTGVNSSSWIDAGNWSGGTPGATNDVLIPNATTTANDPTIPASTTIKSININNGGIVNGGTGTILTIAGSSCWINNGTFNPGTSTVIFTDPTASVAGETNFNNVTIATGAELTMATNNIMRIAGIIVNNGIWRARFLENTVEYNGTNQNIIKPNGGSGGYYHLILSNSGIKTASENLIVAGNLTLSETTTFNAGTSLTHSFYGNCLVNTAAAIPFSYTTANTINFNTPVTPLATSLEGTSAAALGFNNVIINNINGFSSNLNFNITGTLTVAANVVFTPAAAVVINSITTQGAITGSGTVQVTRTTVTADYLSQYKFISHTITNLTVDYTGTAAQTANALTYGNLTISNTAATVTTNGNITVNGVLTLNANLSNGDLAMGANILTMSIQFIL